MANQTNQPNTAVATRQQQSTAITIKKPANYDAIRDTLGVSITDGNSLHKFLNVAQDKAICVFPKTIGKAEPGYSMGITMITVDTRLTSENKYNNADCYQKQGRVMLHWSKINEIAGAAGLEYLDMDVLIEDREAETGELVRVLVKQHWHMMSIDGRMRKGASFGTYDYLQEKKEGKFEYEKRRAWGIKLAHTNAKYRSVMDAIGELPRSFDLEELKTFPILVPSLKKDVSAMLQAVSPEMRNTFTDALIAQRLGLVDQIYGNGNGANNNPARQLATTEPAQQLPIHADAEPEEIPSEVVEETAPVSINPDGSFSDFYADEQAEEAAFMDATIRALMIIDLAEKKGYTPARPLTQEALEKANFNKSIRPLLVKLYSMPDINQQF